MRKIALNLARLYKNRYEPRSAISGILKRNLFDTNTLAKFIRYFIAVISISELLQKLDSRVHIYLCRFVNDMLQN